MPAKKSEQLKRIENGLRDFRKVVEQNARRGRSHRKLMKAFEPMAKDLARRIKAREKASS